MQGARHSSKAKPCTNVDKDAHVLSIQSIGKKTPCPLPVRYARRNRKPFRTFERSWHGWARLHLCTGAPAPLITQTTAKGGTIPPLSDGRGGYTMLLAEGKKPCQQVLLWYFGADMESDRAAYVHTFFALLFLAARRAPPAEDAAPRALAADPAPPPPVSSFVDERSLRLGAMMRVVWKRKKMWIQNQGRLREI